MFLVDPSNLNLTWESQFKFFTLLLLAISPSSFPFQGMEAKFPTSFAQLPLTTYNLKFLSLIDGCAHESWCYCKE